ncbi:MAG: hypothetical protein PHD02_01675 [Bacilli bacterium]|nr:hypothetical protein [Bacilli bacterium]
MGKLKQRALALLLAATMTMPAAALADNSESDLVKLSNSLVKIEDYKKSLSLEKLGDLTSSFINLGTICDENNLESSEEDIINFCGYTQFLSLNSEMIEFLISEGILSKKELTRTSSFAKLAAQIELYSIKNLLDGNKEGYINLSSVFIDDKYKNLINELHKNVIDLSIAMDNNDLDTAKKIINLLYAFAKGEGSIVGCKINEREDVFAVATIYVTDAAYYLSRKNFDMSEELLTFIMNGGFSNYETQYDSLIAAKLSTNEKVKQ